MYRWRRRRRRQRLLLSSLHQLETDRQREREREKTSRRKGGVDLQKTCAGYSCCFFSLSPARSRSSLPSARMYWYSLDVKFSHLRCSFPVLSFSLLLLQQRYPLHSKQSEGKKRKGKKKKDRRYFPSNYICTKKDRRSGRLAPSSTAACLRTYNNEGEEKCYHRLGILSIRLRALLFTSCLSLSVEERARRRIFYTFEANELDDGGGVVVVDEIFATWKTEKNRLASLYIERTKSRCLPCHHRPMTKTRNRSTRKHTCWSWNGSISRNISSDGTDRAALFRTVHPVSTKTCRNRIEELRQQSLRKLLERESFVSQIKEKKRHLMQSMNRRRLLMRFRSILFTS